MLGVARQCHMTETRKSCSNSFFHLHNRNECMVAGRGKLNTTLLSQLYTYIIIHISADPGWSRGSALGKNSFRDCLLTVSAIVSSRVGCNQELNSSGSKRWFCFFAAAAAGAAGATRTAGHSNGSNSRHSQQGQWQQPLQ